jgi:hypothetical protein
MSSASRVLSHDQSSTNPEVQPGQRPYRHLTRLSPLTDWSETAASG